MSQSDLIFTKTDESPDLALTSFLPIIAQFTNAAGISTDTKDISLKSRIIAAFGDYLEDHQKQPDDLAELAQIVKTPQANIIKLPNISATDLQLADAITELQAKGYKLPDYPATPATAEEQAIKARYDALTGSIVNPVLREGNALRLIPKAIKENAQQNPHQLSPWSKDSKTHVKCMDGGDFFATETASTVSAANTGKAKIVFTDKNGNETVLKDNITLRNGDVIDAAIMQRDALNRFLHDAIAKAKKTDMLLSVHLKATMMKKTDGIIFGDAVQVFFEPVFTKHATMFSELGIDPNNGLSDIVAKIEDLPVALKNEILNDIDTCLQNGPDLAMAGKNATHLDAPNNVIMDVSMAKLACYGGQLWDKNNTPRDTMALLPDSTYARMHQAGIEFFQKNGQVDPKTMGTTIAVRLQAGGAQEYGSKNKTFNAPEAGTIKIVAENGTVLHQHDVQQNDIWRMCQTHDDGIKNWVKLGVDQARQTGYPAVFWLDENRKHDAQVIEKVKRYLKEHDMTGLDIRIMSPEKAMYHTLERASQGFNTIAVTGNVIGDHTTDYFPYLEVGNSNKMLSLVQLLDGGLVAETGSGGTAPGLIKGEGAIAGVAHDNHFIWDDAGTALATAQSLRHLKSEKSIVLADTLDAAITKYVTEKRSPSPKGLDTRESQFYLAKYWAEALAAQNTSAELRDYFIPLAKNLELNERKILNEMRQNRGKPVDFGGLYAPDDEKANAIMRPSSTFNLTLET